MLELIITISSNFASFQSFRIGRYHVTPYMCFSLIIDVIWLEVRILDYLEIGVDNVFLANNKRCSSYQNTYSLLRVFERLSPDFEEKIGVSVGRL